MIIRRIRTSILTLIVVFDVGSASEPTSKTGTSAYANDPIVLDPVYHYPNANEERPYDFWHENVPHPHRHGDQPPYDQLHQHFPKYGVDNYDNFITDPPVTEATSDTQADETDLKDSDGLAASDVGVERVKPRLRTTTKAPTGLTNDNPQIGVEPKTVVEPKPKAKSDQFTTSEDVGVDQKAPLASEDGAVSPKPKAKSDQLTTSEDVGADQKTPLAPGEGLVTPKPKAKSDRLTMVVDVGVDDAPLASEDRVVKPAKIQRPVVNEEEFFKAPPGTQPDPFPGAKASSDSDRPYGQSVDTSHPGIKEKTAPSNAEGFIENTDSGRLPPVGEPLTEFEKLPERPDRTPNRPCCPCCRGEEGLPRGGSSGFSPRGGPYGGPGGYPYGGVSQGYGGCTPPQCPPPPVFGRPPICCPSLVIPCCPRLPVCCIPQLPCCPRITIQCCPVQPLCCQPQQSCGICRSAALTSRRTKRSGCTQCGRRKRESVVEEYRKRAKRSCVPCLRKRVKRQSQSCQSCTPFSAQLISRVKRSYSCSSCSKSERHKRQIEQELNRTKRTADCVQCAAAARPSSHLVRLMKREAREDNGYDPLFQCDKSCCDYAKCLRSKPIKPEYSSASLGLSDNEPSSRGGGFRY